MKVRFSYLSDKFDAKHEKILSGISKVAKTGQFTLGKKLEEFEDKLAKMLNVKHAIGVNSGTDALRIPLRLLGVGPGDEVITASNTFIASLGAIDELFAKPVLVDMAYNYVLDTSKINKMITKKTKAIVPVHFTGEPCEMNEVMDVAKKHGIPVVEDACQAIMATYRGRFCGTIGDAGAISLHPLKVLNVWGDGGVIVTNDDALAGKIRLYRNHGLVDRDHIGMFGCNSRLDPIHAAVGLEMIGGTPKDVEKRRANAKRYDEALKACGVHVIHRRDYALSCYHLYMVEVDTTLRDELVTHLNTSGIEAKVHYPIPLYQQEGLKKLGYKPGDFPMADEQSSRILTLPVDEHLTDEMMDYVISTIKSFMEVHSGRVQSRGQGHARQGQNGNARGKQENARA